MNFKKNMLVSSAGILFAGYLSMHSVLASASVSDEAKFAKKLGTHSTDLTATKDDCYTAADSCLLQVTPTTTAQGHRTYNISHICDKTSEQYLYLYKLTMKEQLTSRKFIGQSFCKGIVSISDMKLPFSKGQDIEDANDGVLLIETAESGIKDILGSLDKMKSFAEQAASGVYTSTQLSDLNTEFDMYLTEINRVASVTTFNGVSLLNNSNTITIPFNKGQKNITIQLSNITTGSSGLNIAALSIDTVANGQNALITLPAAISSAHRSLEKVTTNKSRLQEIVELETVVTSIDLNQDIFEVKKTGYIY